MKKMFVLRFERFYQFGSNSKSKFKQYDIEVPAVEPLSLPKLICRLF